MNWWLPWRRRTMTWGPWRRGTRCTWRKLATWVVDSFWPFIRVWERLAVINSASFLVVGDPSSGSEVKPSHSGDTVSQEPAIRSRQADCEPGGEAEVETPSYLFPALVSHVAHFSLQRQCEQARLRENEEKLIVSAWYNKVLLDFSCLFFLNFTGDFSAAKLTNRVRFLPPEPELPEAGDGVSPQRSQRLLLHIPDALLPVPAASSVQRASPGTFHQRACHYLQVDLGVNSWEASLATSHQSTLKWP